MKKPKSAEIKVNIAKKENLMQNDIDLNVLIILNLIQLKMLYIL